MSRSEEEAKRIPLGKRIKLKVLLATDVVYKDSIETLPIILAPLVVGNLVNFIVKEIIRITSLSGIDHTLFTLMAEKNNYVLEIAEISVNMHWFSAVDEVCISDRESKIYYIKISAVKVYFYKAIWLIVSRAILVYLGKN